MELIQVIVTALVSSIGGAISAILIARLSKPKKQQEKENKHLDAQTESEISKAADAIAEGSTAAITNLLRTVEYQRAEIETIKESRRLRDIETQKERDELQARIQADLIETQRLRNEHALQQAALMRVENVAIGLGESINKIKVAMQNANIPLQLNGELDRLMESVVRLKAEKAKRGKE